MAWIPILTVRIGEEPETVVYYIAEVRDFKMVTGRAEGEQVIHIYFELSDGWKRHIKSIKSYWERARRGRNLGRLGGNHEFCKNNSGQRVDWVNPCRLNIPILTALKMMQMYRYALGLS